MFEMIKSTDRKRVFNHTGHICDLITSHPYLIIQKDYLGLTALHWAIRRNSLELVKFLINFKSKNKLFKCNIQAEDDAGR
jgi:ankyrin repeat protein